MEQIDLTTPITNYHVSRLMLDWDNSIIEVIVSHANDKLVFIYYETLAHDLMLALNKTDNSVKSMHRRILEYLITDGKLAGTITGGPD